MSARPADFRDLKADLDAIMTLAWQRMTEPDPIGENWGLGEASAALSATVDSFISSRLAQPRNHAPGEKWTLGEIDKLIALSSSGKTIRQQGRVLGRTYDSVKTARRRLGLVIAGPVRK